MNWDTIRNRCESTPFKTVQLPNGRIDLYWSQRAGAYGHQVYSFVIDHERDETKFDKTNGCGYCKESEALGHAFAFLGVKPKGYTPYSGEIPYQYRVGGNFYRVPKSKLLKFKR